MKIINFSHFGLCVLVLLFAACNPDKSEEDPAPVVKEEGCRLTKIIGDNHYKEYIYDNSNKLVRVNGIYTIDTTLNWRLRYTYNAAGKVITESHYNSNGNLEGRKEFTYNASNLIARSDIYGSYFNGSGGYYLYHYNSNGQMVLAQHYLWAQPVTLDYYSEYFYFPDKILGKHYNALTTPATLTDTVNIYFDDKKSIYSGLEFMDIIIPEITKHNVVVFDSRKVGVNSVPHAQYSSYKYNVQGYPVEEKTSVEMFLSSYAFEYDCQ